MCVLELLGMKNSGGSQCQADEVVATSSLGNRHLRYS